jgi:hypothetical protein
MSHMETADPTIMRKWKIMFVIGCECEIPINTAKLVSRGDRSLCSDIH